MHNDLARVQDAPACLIEVQVSRRIFKRDALKKRVRA